PFVDNIIFIKNNQKYHRTPEVIDVWFDSGSMPFAQFHYPFENQELFNQQFPADFIAEGVDQTRGWFYTLHNIATALFNKPAYKNIVVNELILDSKGVKMSKSKGNVIDSFEIMEKYGADAVRWYLFVNNPPWKPTLFNPEDLERTVISDFLRSLTNTYTFFAMYANIDNFDPNSQEIPLNERPVIDKWIISRINSIAKQYAEFMDAYELTKAHRLLQDFTINELSNWYIRRNRRRFWKGENDSEKLAAYQTLYFVLKKLIILISSAAPFISEDLYQKLRIDTDPVSVHLEDFPEIDNKVIDLELEGKMALIEDIVWLARSLREKARIRVRQPLTRLLIPTDSVQTKREIMEFADIILEELNIKNIEFISTDNTDIIKRKAKPNFKVMGKKFGKLMKVASEAVAALTSKQIIELEKNGRIELDWNGEHFEFVRDDVEIYNEDIEGWLVATDGKITVALDTTIDEKLRQEGIAREFVSKIQNLRKDQGFEVIDRIEILFNTNSDLKDALLNMKDYVQSETLAVNMNYDENLQDGTEIDILENKVKVIIKKV
ncbi:MAG TPA: DUF5915 domain-containing protein, partial [Candidatus Kapabacteria bacterium]|nr:DUF5915 domain-containing protein [Candidatus Kapabacteria bacterium]